LDGPAGVDQVVGVAVRRPRREGRQPRPGVALISLLVLLQLSARAILPARPTANHPARGPRVSASGSVATLRGPGMSSLGSSFGATMGSAPVLAEPIRVPLQGRRLLDPGCVRPRLLPARSALYAEGAGRRGLVEGAVAIVGRGLHQAGPLPVPRGREEGR